MDGTREPPLFGTALRQPPANVEAEQALLGALLANNKAFERVAEFLRPEHFAHPAHCRIYQAIGKHIVAGRIADAVTLKAEFEHAGILDEVGGATYLAQLLSAMVGIINAGEYGRAIHDAWQRRQMIDIGTELVNEAFAAAQPPGDLAAAVLGRLDAVTAAGHDREPIGFDEALDDVLRASYEAGKRQGPIGISTGMASVDAILGGFEPGTFNVLAGRPGMGKTALGLQWAVSAARAGHKVFVVSLEMSARSLARRSLASVAGVSVARIRRGDLSEDDAGQLVLARRELADLPLTIEDSAALTPSMIALKARMWRRRKGIDLLILDHLHIVRPETADVRAGATWAVGQIAQSLQQLAKDLAVPVLALAQLNRGVDGRDDHRPTKADLRQSGDIEQCADAIMFVYRPEYYLGKSPPERGPKQNDAQHGAAVDDWNLRKSELAGKAELIFDKVRDGAEALVRLHWDGRKMMFSEVNNGW